MSSHTSCRLNLRIALLLPTLVAAVSLLLSCARQSRTPSKVNALPSKTTDRQLINVNSASAATLETLPGIGKGLAERIIEHREKFGPFRRAEHLLIVRGISDKRFRALRDLITVE